ncbi:MAG: PaaI family thioesterase [Microlunatus sp.]|nr:PaaI family thioesterase [Microlunatus sp.]
MMERTEPPMSVQDRYFPDLTCFGCGPRNDKGLRLKSFLGEADGTLGATFRPWPEHDNGLGFLNGGIIATLLDCHSAASVVVTSEREGLVPDGTLQYVTAGLDLRYQRPSPLHDHVDLVAWAASADERVIVIDVELWWQEKVRAAATVTWKRWRPRPGHVGGPATAPH